MDDQTSLTITGLIAELERLRTEHGDLPVYITGHDSYLDSEIQEPFSRDCLDIRDTEVLWGDRTDLPRRLVCSV